MLTFHEPDIAQRMRTLKESRAAFEAAGYVERIAVIAHNVAILYDDMDCTVGRVAGCWRRVKPIFALAHWATALRSRP